VELTKVNMNLPKEFYELEKEVRKRCEVKARKQKKSVEAFFCKRVNLGGEVSALRNPILTKICWEYVRRHKTSEYRPGLRVELNDVFLQIPLWEKRWFLEWSKKQLTEEDNHVH